MADMGIFLDFSFRFLRGHRRQTDSQMTTFGIETTDLHEVNANAFANDLRRINRASEKGLCQQWSFFSYHIPLTSEKERYRYMTTRQKACL